MTERERLIKLLLTNEKVVLCDGCLGFEKEKEAAAKMADYLLANGVRLPVTCEECKHSREKTNRECFVYCEDVVICTHPEVGMECELPVHGDFYCAYGERREDNV